jgi:hypothetical protein
MDGEPVSTAQPFDFISQEGLLAAESRSIVHLGFGTGRLRRNNLPRIWFECFFTERPT